MKELTQEYLKEILDYNHFNGEFHWIKRRKKVQIYSVAGCVNKKGYRCIRIDGKLYFSHRLAFLYMTGNFPSEHCDHLNHNRLDNRWVNLRPVSRQDNNKNRSINANNKSGFTGVHWDKHANKWLAKININCKSKYLGLFTELDDAINARKNANSKYEYHTNHGAIS